MVCEISGYFSNLGISINFFNSSSIKANDNVVFKVRNEDDIVYLSEKTTDLTEEEIWSTIENKEWVTFEGGFAGYGIYFYIENDIKYALTMTFGSGVPVVDTYKSEVRLKDNRVNFDFPTELHGGNMGPRQIGIIYKDNTLYIGNEKLESNPENPTFFYDEWLKMN